MYYLFYNPLAIPHATKMPMEQQPELGDNVVGCRVVQKARLDDALSAFDTGYSPSYRDLLDNLSSSFEGVSSSAGWRLEDLAADLMLKCKAGLVDESPTFESLLILMNQKQRPMSGAISITFDVQQYCPVCPGTAPDTTRHRWPHCIRSHSEYIDFATYG